MKNNNEEVVETKKGKNNVLIIGVIIFGLLMFAGGFFASKMLNNNKAENSSQKETKTEEKTEEKKEPKEEKKTEEKPKETFDLAKFNPSRVINGKSNMKYSEEVSEVSNTLISGEDLLVAKAELQEDGKTVVVSINWPKMDPEDAMNSSIESKMTKYNVVFANKVKAVYISGWGQGWGSETIFYLMENGTVEYTPITPEVVEKVKQSPDSMEIKSNGKIPNVEGVVIIVRGGVTPTDSEYGGGAVVLGIKANGEFYDLSDN